MKKVIIILAMIFVLAAMLAPITFAQTTEPQETVSWSAQISDWIAQYASEIMSGATVLGSLGVAFLFKKGLLPAVSAGLSKITGATAKATEKLTTTLSGAQHTLDTITAQFSALTTDMQRHNAAQDLQLSTYRTIMQSQVDMISTLLLNLNISVDQRAVITDQVAAMKAKISNLTEE